VVRWKQNVSIVDDIRIKRLGKLVSQSILFWLQVEEREEIMEDAGEYRENIMRALERQEHGDLIIEDCN
jgi:hypothetical protein